MTEPAKKGLGPLGWILIGCGGITLIGVIVFVVLSLWVFKKGKDFVEEAEKNPEIATAKAIAAFNPEIEYVSADEENKQITFRNEKTGEEIVVDFSDLKDGELSFQTAEGESTINFDSDGETGGQLTVTGADGTTTFSAGAPLTDRPQWVPDYPGSEPTTAFDARTDDGRSVTYQFTTTDSIDEVLKFFKEELEDTGFEINSNRISGSAEGGVLTGRSKVPHAEISVTVGLQDGTINVVVQATERK